ncbi:MAG: hypothetical protein DMF44_07490 [Verrucomicrobia bacterium]|nr:MAG: hypothetical protein DMF44_07490 [Verrucomicrobiota bacterium]
MACFRTREKYTVTENSWSLDATQFAPKSLNRKRKRLDTMARILYRIFDYVIRRFNAPSAGLNLR